MYTAMLYLVFERQDGKLGHRLLRKTPIEADTLNAAKAQTTRLVKKDERMSAWVALDSMNTLHTGCLSSRGSTERNTVKTARSQKGITSGNFSVSSRLMTSFWV